MTNQRMRRDVVFGFADARGNNPHGTRETAEHEGRRLNAQRYETVGQMDRALDARARSLHGGTRGARMPGLGPMGSTSGPFVQGTGAPSSGPSFWETVFIFAAGAGLMYLVTKKDTDEEVFLDAASLLTNPALPAPVTVVLNPSAQPTPVVAVASPVEKLRRKHRSVKEVKAAKTATALLNAPTVIALTTSVE